ncbi:MAG TPA: hypothetical protein VGL93_00930 [Streptosporangiaceae bacterium]|jgi:hypothetical protein
MPSPQHEALHQIAREHPDAVEYALRQVHGIKIPRVRGAEIINVDCTTIEAVERRVDSAIRLDTDEGPLALLVESQLAHEPLKQSRWPFYAAYIHDQYDCPVLLVVLCRDARTARRLEAPLTIGVDGFTCMTVRAIVFGPHNVPRITTLADATDDVPFTVLSALIHGDSPDVNAILEPLAEALAAIDPQTAVQYFEFTEAGLIDAETRRIWRDLVKAKPFPYVSELRAEFAAEGRAEGRVEEAAENLLLVLNGRGVELTDERREQVTSCTDLGTLHQWLVRAAAGEGVEEIFR